jgi:hypothetical protein
MVVHPWVRKWGHLQLGPFGLVLSKPGSFLLVGAAPPTLKQCENLSPSSVTKAVTGPGNGGTALRHGFPTQMVSEGGFEPPLRR